MSTPVSGKALFLLRALFPSWKFFEDIDEIPRLLYRTSISGEDNWSSWALCIPLAKHHPLQLLWNPNGNLLLAYSSLVQQLVGDLEDLAVDSPASEAVAQLVSYQLLKNLVRSQAIEDQKKTGAGYYQFKLSFSQPGNIDPARMPSDLEDSLISAVYPVLENSPHDAMSPSQ